jgi:chromosome segregation ATPase
MSDLTDRLRGLYVANGTNYVQEAADEIDKLRVTNKMLQDDKAALRETQAKFGQVQHDLLSQIDALREQLALAESVRAAQVAGLTEGAEKLRERVKALEDALQTALKWAPALTPDEYAKCHAALKGEA